MHFKGRSMTNGRDSGFCITILHRATHRLFSNSSLRKTFLSSLIHHNPDLAPSDFWLFLTLKLGLNGTVFTTMEHIKSSGMAELWKIPKEAFCRCLQQWQDG
jgi:hypothetical protein